MGTDFEAAACAFIRTFDGKKVDRAKVKRALQLMTPDARYYVYAWDEPVVGREAIEIELLKQAPLYSDTVCEIQQVASVGQTVFIQRIDHVTMFGRRLSVAVVGVFELDADGKVTSWHDYHDSNEINTKLRQTLK